MMMSYSHGREFVRQLLPLLERHDLDAVVRHVHHHWSADALRGLLVCGHDDARRVALCCLSLIGTKADEPAVMRLLQEDDGQTVTLAEQALWSIWFAHGDVRANGCMLEAARLISSNHLQEAIHILNRVTERWPEFAEAYHQRAIARLLAGDHAAALDDCRRCLERNHLHFGVLAVQGHAHALRGEFKSALTSYRRALILHPRMEGLREAIGQLRLSIEQVEASGDPQPTTD